MNFETLPTIAEPVGIIFLLQNQQRDGECDRGRRLPVVVFETRSARESASYPLFPNALVDVNLLDGERRRQS